jgi:hypothetical protein
METYILHSHLTASHPQQIRSTRVKTTHYILARTLIKSTPRATQNKNNPLHYTVGHSVISKQTQELLPQQHVTRTPAPTCSQTYCTHTPCTLHPFLQHHHVSTHSSFVHAAAVKNESSTTKLCTNLPSLWVNGLVQANNRASPPCHFVLSTPSNYKFFQEMAREFQPLLQARGNFTLIHFHAPHTHTHRELRVDMNAICHCFPRTDPVLWVLKNSVLVCSQLRPETKNSPALSPRSKNTIVLKMGKGIYILKWKVREWRCVVWRS